MTTATVSSTEAPPQHQSADSRVAERWTVRTIGGLSAGLLGLWVVTAIVAASRGLDLTDESFYLLSYRWWSTENRTFSGVQYVYGPVYQALGYDIAALRIFRVVTIVAANAAFALAFMRWLQTRRTLPHAATWQVTGVLAITTVGGLALSWLPRSPGYNDVSALGALVVGAGILELARCAHRRSTPSVLVGAALGLVGFAMMVTKWASGLLTVGSLAFVGVIVLWPRGRRAVARFVVPLALSGLAGLVLFHLFLAPVDRVARLMLETNRIVARATNSPGSLLLMYVAFTRSTIKWSLVLAWPLVSVAAVAPFLRGRVPRSIGLGALVVAAGTVVYRVLEERSYWGGASRLPGYVPVVTAGIIVAACLLVSSWLARRWDARRLRTAPTTAPGTAANTGRWEFVSDLAVIGMLILLPVLQAAGTGNPILYLALSGYGAWAALVIWAWTGLSTQRDGWPAWATGAVALVLLMSTATAATVTGIWFSPYRTAPSADSTVRAPDVPVLSSLTFDPVTAEDIAGFVAALRPWTERPGRQVMAFDELAGLVLVVDGRSVGEAWYSALDPERTSYGIEVTCRANGPLTAEKPILIFRREILESDERALRACGLDMGKDYRELAGIPPRLSVVVYVPKDTP